MQSYVSSNVQNLTRPICCSCTEDGARTRAQTHLHTHTHTHSHPHARTLALAHNTDTRPHVCAPAQVIENAWHWARPSADDISNEAHAEWAAAPLGLAEPLALTSESVRGRPNGSRAAAAAAAGAGAGAGTSC